MLYEDATRIDYGDINGKVDSLLKELTTSKGWILVGDKNKSYISFTWNFNGDGKRLVIYIWIVSDVSNSVGLFGYSNGGEILKLNLSGNISNCYNYVVTIFFVTKM